METLKYIDQSRVFVIENNQLNRKQCLKIISTIYFFVNKLFSLREPMNIRFHPKFSFEPDDI